MCLLIGDSNVNTKETEKLSKEIVISRLRELRTKIFSVTTGASGTIKKGLDQNLQLLPGHHQP
jgi:hypothetical protein